MTYSVKDEYHPIDLEQNPLYSDASWRPYQKKEIEEEAFEVSKLWNMCIQGNERDTTDERYKTVCCGNSIDDRKFINVGIVTAVAGAGSVVAASFFNNVPVMVVGAVFAVGGLVTAISPKVIKCCRRE